MRCTRAEGGGVIRRSSEGPDENKQRHLLVSNGIPGELKIMAEQEEIIREGVRSPTEGEMQ